MSIAANPGAIGNGVSNALIRSDSTLFSVPIAAAAIKLAARTAWSRRVAKLMAQHPPIVNPTPGVVNTFKFINPQATFNGDGSLPTDAASGGAAGAYNAIPTMVANTSYLFLEGSTWTASAGGGTANGILVTQNGVLFGTYALGSSAAAPTRVFDLGRVAKLDMNQSRRGFASATFNNWAVSGLEIYNLEHATQPEGVSLGTITSGSGADCVAEYLYVHDLVTTTTTTNGAGIFNRSTNGTVRFCKVRTVGTDGIVSSPSGISGAGENPQHYGNDVEVMAGTLYDNPDAMQMSHTVAMKSLRVQDNWLNNSNVNLKQCLIVSDTGFATNKGGYIGGNVFIGADVSALPPLSGANQKCVQIGIPNVKFWNNITIGGEYGLFVDANGVVDARGNLIFMSASGATTNPYSQYGINFSTGSASVAEFNTVVLLAAVTGSRGIIQSGASVHQSNANIISGPWAIGIRKASSGTEANNAIYGATIPVSNSSDVLTTPAASTTTTFNALLAELLQPTVAVPVMTSYTAFDEDTFGNAFRGAIGAYQG